MQIPEGSGELPGEHLPPSTDCKQRPRRPAQTEVCKERKGVQHVGDLLSPTPAKQLARREENWPSALTKACVLPPLGQGIGVSRVINLVVIFVWGHDTWRERKGTLHTAVHPRFAVALCPSSGSWHKKGNPSIALIPAHMTSVVEKLLILKI